MTKKVKKGSVLVLVLTLVFSATIMPRVQAATAVDTDRSCSLQFDLRGVGYDEVKTLPIEVEIYKVADIDASGVYHAEKGYTLGTISDETKTEDWAEMAADAMEVATGKEPTATSTAMKGFDGLEVGLYLVVAKETESATFKYSFTPYLVSLPNNNYYQTQNDDWVYDVKTSLKPLREDRYGDLVIEKELSVFNETVGGATFVFQIEATKDYATGNGESDLKTVYSDVVSITFEKPGVQQVLVEQIPAGAKVTVTEVYSGGSYTAVGDIIKNTIIVADNNETADAEKDSAAQVFFENTYDGRLNGGCGVVNHFEQGENGWQWTQWKDSTESMRKDQ